MSKKSIERVKVSVGRLTLYIFTLIANGYLFWWAYQYFLLDSRYLSEDVTALTGLAFIIEIIFSFYIFIKLLDNQDDSYYQPPQNNNNGWGGWNNNYYNNQNNRNYNNRNTRNKTNVRR